MAALVKRRNGVCTFYDGTGTPLEVTASPGEGNYTIDGIEANGREAEMVFDRDGAYEWSETQDKEISGSITVHHAGDLTDASTTRLMDIVRNTGAFAAGVSTDNGAWAARVDCAWTDGDSVVHTISCNKVRVSASYSEGQAFNSITVSWRGYVAPTITSA